MSIDWKDLQYSFKQLHISLTDVQNKEIEMQKILSSSLNLYYKYKRKILLYINNIQGFMGLNKNIFYQDTIKVKVEGANKDDVYIFGPLKTYLLLFRNNFGNLFKFLNYLKPEEFGKIALLLTHFFYEDITLNESSDALNYIYFHLLSNELNNFCDSYFLDSYISPYSLTAKVTEQLLQRNEIKLYISHIVSNSINDMEEYCEKYFTMNITLDLEVLEECVKINTNKALNNEKMNTLQKSKTMLNTNQNVEKKNLPDTPLAKRQSVFGIPEKKKGEVEILGMDKINKILKEETDYTQKTLKNLMKKVENSTYKLIYLRQLNQINNPDCKNIFSLQNFKEKLKTKGDYRKLYTYYNQNLNMIKDFISSLINNIIKLKDFVPKLIKSAYLAIYNHFHINYQNIDYFEVNLFMINYLFEYIIIPMLKIPEINELLVKEKIFDLKTHQDLIPIIMVLRHICNCHFFVEDDYKMLNNFVLEQHANLQNYFSELSSDFERQIYHRQNSDNILINENYQTMCLSRDELKIFINHFKEMEFEDEKEELKRMVEDSDNLIYDNKNENQFFVFTNLNYNGERKEALKIEKKVEKNTSFVGEDGDEMLFVENIKNCINYVLVNVPPIRDEFKNADFEGLFSHLNDIINYHKDEYKDTFGNKNIPLSWYSNYIINILEKLPRPYVKNNYLKLFNEMNTEIKEQRIKIANKNDVLSIDLSSEINIFKKMVKIYKHQLKLCKTLDLNAKVLYFIENADLPICMTTGSHQFDTVYDLFGQETAKKYQELQLEEILIETQPNCIHTKYENKNPKMSNDSRIKLKGYKEKAHANTVVEFTKLIENYILLIVDDIFSKIKTKSKKDYINKTKANEVLENYIVFIDDVSKEKYKEFFISKDEKSFSRKQKDFLKKVQLFILRKISLSIKKQGKSFEYYIDYEDEKFKNKCLQLRWLDPVDNLQINPSMVSNTQINLARDLIRKMDRERAGPKIIKYFSKAVNIIVKMITFTTGREDLSIDDFLPIMVYLFISVAPVNVISNFGNATYFMLSSEENENTGYNLANIEGCINFINMFNEERCNMTKEEFNENCRKSLQMNSLSELLNNISKKDDEEIDQNKIESEGNYINEG